VTTGRTGAALTVLCTASFIAVADTTIVSIALPSMRQALGFSTSGLQWVLNAYALTFGGMLLLCGRIGDQYGRRRLFTYGLALFAAGSLLGGLAWGPGALISGRFLQGLGAAAFVPASLSLLTTIFTEDAERNRAIGFYGAMAALGFVVGMLGGGLITELWGWRWVLFVNVPVAVVTLVCGLVVLAEGRNRRNAHGVDILGACAVTGGLVAVIYAMSLAPEVGWTSTRTLVTGVAGLALLIVFAAIERVHRAPLVPPSVVVKWPVLLPNIAIALQSMIGIAWLYVLTLYFQEVLDHGPLRTGLLFAPMTVAAIVAAPAGGRLSTRLGLRLTCAAGLSLVGFGLIAMINGLNGSLALVISGMVVGEAGFMLSNVSLTAAGTRHLGTAHGGLAAGLLNTSTQLGNGWGLAVVAVVIASVQNTSPATTDPVTYVHALRLGLWACTCFCVLALLLVVVGLERTAPRRSAM
jgi:EmrB/QacA subfamily drug resistance transporter